MHITLLLLLPLFSSIILTTGATPAWPAGWIVNGRANPDVVVHVTFAIKQRNLDVLERTFWSVSDPTSDNYGKFLTHEEIKKLVAPLPSSIQTVQNWLLSHNIIDATLENSGDFIRTRIPVSAVERMLGVEMMNFEHADTGTRAIRSSSKFAMPDVLTPHVDFIGGISQLPKLKKRTTKLDAPLQNLINPAVAKKFFQMDSTLVGTNANNSQAVAQFLGQYYSPSDLLEFQQKMGVATDKVEKVVGPNKPGNPGLEASLDIEYIMGIAQKVPTWFVYTAGLYQGQEPFLDWVVNMSSDASSPLVHSVSYGDEESSVELAYINRIEVEFQKYGIMGRSILFASGDDGTGCSKCKYFSPNWPASSQFVTSVGGIYLEGNEAIGDPISSGGFSNVFPQPSYQKDAVSSYIASHTSPDRDRYNATGRAMPDIASFSENVQIVVGGGETFVAGTSCASPVVAGVVALINDARLNAGLPPMGFLNPFLYQTLAIHPDAFVDITKGENGSGCCGTGFQAAEGWDPITGVGAPNWPKLVAYALSAGQKTL